MIVAVFKDRTLSVSETNKDGKKALTFELSGKKATMQHRDLVNVYYFILQSINLYLKKDVLTKMPTYHRKNFTLKNVFINKKTGERKDEITKEEAENYYRVAKLYIEKASIPLNLQSLIAIKEFIEDFFSKTDFEIYFKTNQLDKLIIKKENGKTSFQFIEKNNSNKEVLTISKEQTKLFIRAIKDKMVYDWKIYNINLQDIVKIKTTKLPNVFAFEFRDKKYSISRDILLAMSLSV